MSFTNTWDNTFPPDTQAANQLGADLRNFRLDAQQRMAAMSGLDANKPNFEAGFAGVLYFSTDVGKIFQWSGSAWTDVTSDFITAQATLLLNMPFSTNPTWDVSTLSQIRCVFEMTLTGDVTSGTLANIVPGQEITFIIHQDGAGAHFLVWPGGINNGADISATASSTSVQSFVVAADGVNLYPTSPMQATA